jgi:hypothetical protein
MTLILAELILQALPAGEPDRKRWWSLTITTW